MVAELDSTVESQRFHPLNLLICISLTILIVPCFFKPETISNSSFQHPKQAIAIAGTIIVAAKRRNIQRPKAHYDNTFSWIDRINATNKLASP